MKIDIFAKLAVILALSISLCGCAAILVSQKEVAPPETQPLGENTCITDIKTFKRLELGSGPPKKSEPKPLQTKSGFSYHEISDLLLSEWKNKIPNSLTCETKLNATVEISNEPTTERQGLILLNMITIGIIPYWGEEANTLLVKLYDQNGSLKNTYSSTINYMRIQSIFLIPAAPFYIGGTNELDLNTIPVHMSRIAKLMGYDKIQSAANTSSTSEY